MSTIPSPRETERTENVVGARTIQITVYGMPAPQGSKRFVGHAKNGRGIMIESSKKVMPWREAVKWAARGAGVHGAAQGLTGPVEVEMIFTLPKPKSAPKGRVTHPDKKPDLSKLVRSTEDALTDAGVWEDDARVIRCISEKVFPGEHPNSLGSPGCLIRIRRLAPEEKAYAELGTRAQAPGPVRGER